jgi:hypothetical protein
MKILKLVNQRIYLIEQLPPNEIIVKPYTAEKVLNVLRLAKQILQHEKTELTLKQVLRQIKNLIDHKPPSMLGEALRGTFNHFTMRNNNDKH